MSVSEWSLPIERGNIASRVGEYSISSVGPGPRAKKHWGLAKARGLGTVAKVQVNASWELSAMPYLPVMRTVAEHCRNLAVAGAENLMLSWTVGGYPSPNLDLVRRMTATPTPDIGSTLLAVAADRYGPKSAPEAVRAWNAFSDAFSEYPFHVGFVYNGPAQVAPANPLYPSPTGWSSTMVGFPYDDLEGWRQVYPAEVLGSQFEKMASLWSAGIPPFEKAAKKASTPDNRAKVIVNERTGTVIMGSEVAISSVAIAHGNLKIRVSEQPQVSQPLPFSEGRTTVVPQTDVDVEESGKRLILLKGSATIGDLVNALNAVGVSPRDLVMILQGIKRSGALYAELEVI
ncbi:MAG TPA: flagellar basal body P-ring protein FlgI [Deltaproteobacteria bacterium]|nr:flagellar basal body P-ring protein FlgI [Deltaproteobacteria bacterium]